MQLHQIIAIYIYNKIHKLTEKFSVIRFTNKKLF